MTHVHYDVDAAISQMTALLTASFAENLERAHGETNKKFVEVQHRLEIARLHVERSVMELLNDGYDAEMVFDAVGLSAGLLLGSKVKSTLGNGNILGVNSMLQSFQMSMQHVISSKDGYDAESGTTTTSLEIEPMQSGHA